MVSSDTTALHGPGSEPVTDANFGNRLAALRKERGLTQQATPTPPARTSRRSGAMKPAPAGRLSTSCVISR